jgi:hypothetical protein
MPIYLFFNADCTLIKFSNTLETNLVPTFDGLKDVDPLALPIIEPNWNDAKHIWNLKSSERSDAFKRAITRVSLKPSTVIQCVDYDGIPKFILPIRNEANNDLHALVLYDVGEISDESYTPGSAWGDEATIKVYMPSRFISIWECKILSSVATPDSHKSQTRLATVSNSVYASGFPPNSTLEDLSVFIDTNCGKKMELLDAKIVSKKSAQNTSYTFSCYSMQEVIDRCNGKKYGFITIDIRWAVVH